jgi:O-antigen/teichoic acid export membrane protein
MLRTAFIILSGNAAASLLLLIRNLVVARMIPVADYGIASTFAMVMAIVEMSSALGLQQQIIQSKDGDDPRFQAALQGFQVLRGCMSGLILFVTAGVMARFLGIPEVAWAYQVLALVPVLNALVHFDIHRINRHMRFWPMLLSGIIPALLSLLLVWPFAYWFGNWQIMLWAIIAQAALTVLVSHVLAERPYRLVWDRTIMAGSLRFGWPLLVNAMLMFLVFQGDKLIVGRTMGMTELAIFSMGTTLTLTPTLVLAKSAQNLFLPRLSQLASAKEFDRKAFDVMARIAVQAALLNGAIVILAATLLGDAFVHLVLGPKYAGLVPLLSAFAIVYGVRVFKAGPGMIALARGFTGNSMAGNLPRVAALPLGWLLLNNGGSILQLLWLGIVTEVIGFALSMVMVVRRPGVDFGPLWPTALAMLLFLVLSGGLSALSPEVANWATPLAVLLSFSLILVTMRDLLHRLKSQSRS